MNGRIYDPLLGRFLSADVFVPEIGNLQSFNRYSYVKNNPLSALDPSGYTDINLMSATDTVTMVSPGMPSLTVHARDTFGAYPSNQTGRTSITFHGDPNGGFVADRNGFQNISMARIDQELTDFKHTDGNEILALVCYGGVGTNLTEFSSLARLRNSPVLVATDEITIDVSWRKNGTVRSYNGVKIANGGHWLVIEPNGTVRDRGTDANATQAETDARAAQAASQAATDKATTSQVNAANASAQSAAADAVAQQARIDANLAKSTPEAEAAKAKAVDAEKAAAAAKQNATQAATQATADKKAADDAAARAKEAEELARKLRNEANSPI